MEYITNAITMLSALIQMVLYFSISACITLVLVVGVFSLLRTLGKNFIAMYLDYRYQKALNELMLAAKQCELEREYGKEQFNKNFNIKL